MKEATGLEPKGGKNNPYIQGLIEEYNMAATGGAPAFILKEIQEEIDNANRQVNNSKGRMQVNIGKLFVDIVLGDNDFSLKRHPISGFIKKTLDYVAEKIRLLKEKRALLRGTKEREESNTKRM